MEEEESETEIDMYCENFHDMVLDHKAVNALCEDVEENMDKCYVEFRVVVEAERQKDMKERIICKYKDIREHKAG